MFETHIVNHIVPNLLNVWNGRSRFQDGNWWRTSCWNTSPPSVRIKVFFNLALILFQVTLCLLPLLLHSLSRLRKFQIILLLVVLVETTSAILTKRTRTFLT